MAHLSRRSFLQSTGSAAGIAALGTSGLFGFSRAFAQQASGTNDDVQTILNLAATAELFASTHYLAAINAAEAGDLDLADVQIDYLKAAFISERDHYDLLVSLGASPVVTEFYVPEGLFEDVEMFSQVTEVAETAFVSAYLAATRIFTELEQTPFAVTTAQIAAVEAEHRALVRQIGMRLANDRSYQAYQLENVSDAVPVLQPFLDGSGEGFVGPVQPPTDDEVAAIRAQATQLGYMNGVEPFAAMNSASTTDNTMMTGDMAMMVMALANANVREMPSTSAAIVGSLAQGATAEVDGQRAGSDGFIWWHLAMGGWVREDTVREGDSVRSAPQM